MMKSETNKNPGLKLFIMGGLAAVGVSLVMDVRRVVSLDRATSRPENCQGEVNAGATVSREQLAQFLAVSERDSKARVQEILQAPYCQLSGLEVRAGVAAERAVYPLAFDPQTWLVVLYEGDEYAGYQFRFQH